MQPLTTLTQFYGPAIENHLRTVVARLPPPVSDLREMLAYHMGWEGPGAGPEATGKRIRPLLVVLSNAAIGGNWLDALPAAAAVELLHNFSLIHDDIEDNSPLRRGRPTVWQRWGIPLAINAGDAQYSLAYQALSDLKNYLPAGQVLEAYQIMQNTCLALTYGQHLDISFEKRNDLSVAQYMHMIEGKTAALVAACAELGGLTGGANAERRAALRAFGLNLGLAFQVLDDILGVWGDSAVTGKSTESDLVAGKNSLPILFANANFELFAMRWAQGEIRPEEIPTLVEMMEGAGARRYAQNEAERLTDAALHALERAAPQGEAGVALRQLAELLLNRQA